MFERFTERARQVIVLAQEEARTLKHGYIGTEHILLGLLREEEGIAARALEELHVSADMVRVRLIRMIGTGDGTVPGQIPFTPRSKKVIELALREALSLGHNWIGTEHILLALVREFGGAAARMLRDVGLDAEVIRNEVSRLLDPPVRAVPQPQKESAPVTVTLSLPAARWLLEEMGRYPRNDPDSGEVYDALAGALDAGSVRDRKAANG
jgi:ATP-dependent Clp protease ATP-binding subunit ClpC